jgi:hypothetical protein
VLQAHLSSPAIRIRGGYLCGPEIGEQGGGKVRSVIAVSIDGSITVLKPCEIPAFHLMRWIQEYWVRELRQYQPILGN